MHCTEMFIIDALALQLTGLDRVQWHLQNDYRERADSNASSILDQGSRGSA